MSLLNQEGIRRRSTNLDILHSRRSSKLTTLYENFKFSAENFHFNKLFGTRKFDGEWREYEWQTYSQVYSRVKNLASGIMNTGLKQDDKVGIFSRNRAEWHMASEACIMHSICTVALYDSMSLDNLTHIMNECEIATLFCSKENLDVVYDFTPKCKSLRRIITFDQIIPEDIYKGEKLGLDVFYLGFIEDLGKMSPVEHHPPTPESLLTIIYTSGTTGLPKGVMITHENMVASVTGIIEGFMKVTPQDTALSFLPLAHSLARVSEFAMISCGVKIGFYHGDIHKIADDLKVLQPTLLVAVPRILDKISLKFRNEIDESPRFIQYLFQSCFKKKKDSMDIKRSYNGVLDYIIFGRMKNSLGGKIRGIISGGAFLRKDTQLFLSTCLGCPVIQGFGATETCGASTLQNFENYTIGNVGIPLSCCEIKLIDVPDMGYFANQSYGEILIRGYNVCKGYFKDDEKTKESFDNEGWFHTGDIGRWNNDRTLSIVDRKKNIFKLSQGEFVSAELLENIYLKGKYISRIFIYGDSTKSYLVAIGVIKKELIHSLGKKLGIPTESVHELCQDLRIKTVILQDLEQIARKEKLKGYEFIKDILLTDHDFDLIHGLTPTLKLKRHVIKKFYENEINSMYQRESI